MTAIVLRKNTFTGVLYRDDPTILAWDIANEPSNPGDDSGDILQVSNSAPYNADLLALAIHCHHLLIAAENPRQQLYRSF